MSQGRILGDEFWAQCRECRGWQEVYPELKKADLYFEYWQARFCCCQQEQSIWFTIEKVDDDVH
jgi:hypothetical protein